MQPIRMKGHVPGTGPRRHGRKRHGSRREDTGGEIEIQDVDLVGAQIDAEYVMCIEIGQDLVRVRALLSIRIGSATVADTLKIGRHRADRAVGLDPKRRKVAGRIIGRKEIASARMHAQVRRMHAVRRDHIEERQRPVGRIQRISTDAAGQVLVDRIQVGQRRIEREKRRVRCGNDLQQRQVAVARVHPEHRNADCGTGVRASRRNIGSRIGADVDEACIGTRLLLRAFEFRRQHARRGGNSRRQPE